MIIHLHVERVVLHGLAFEAGGADAFRRALGAELSRLLRGEIPLTGSSGGAVPLVRTAPVMLEPGAAPARVGEQVAQAVYGSLGS